MYKENLKNYLKKFVAAIVYLERKQILIVCLFTFALFLALFFNLTVFPSFMEISEHKRAIYDLEKSIVAAEKRVKGLEKFDSNLKDINNKLLEKREFLITNGEVQNLISMVADYGNEAGIDFIEFSPMPLKKGRYLTEIPLSVMIKGGFKEIYRFAEKLSRGKSLITLDKIEISSVTNSDKLSVRCLLKGYGTDEL